MLISMAGQWKSKQLTLIIDMKMSKIKYVQLL